MTSGCPYSPTGCATSSTLTAATPEHPAELQAVAEHAGIRATTGTRGSRRWLRRMAHDAALDGSSSAAYGWLAGLSINDVAWALPDAERLPAWSRGRCRSVRKRLGWSPWIPVEKVGMNEGMMAGDLTVSLCF